ncbi:MAG TPA: hypothetical protein VFV74_00870 [Burkholderiales bacterium]|nr:hypothetical protein [Burkholderiales bacterium]
MDTTDIAAVARHMFQAQGAKAVAEAAQNAERHSQSGDTEQAKFWERVEIHLREMTGPRQT